MQCNILVLFVISFCLRGSVCVQYTKYKSVRSNSGRNAKPGRSTIMRRMLCAIRCSFKVECLYFGYRKRDTRCKLWIQKRKNISPESASMTTINWKAVCPSPPRVSHAKRQTAQGIAHYQCNKKFRLFGNNDIKCNAYWPVAPKCKRTHWRNPRMTRGVFTANIPWGMKESSSLSLKGLTTQGRFTIILGDVKSSSAENTEQTFLFRLNAQVSKTKLDYSFLEGSMGNVTTAETWNTNTSVPFSLDIYIMKNDFKCCVIKGTHKQCTKHKNAMNVTDVKALSIFKNFMIESVALHLD